MVSLSSKPQLSWTCTVRGWLNPDASPIALEDTGQAAATAAAAAGGAVATPAPAAAAPGKRGASPKLFGGAGFGSGGLEAGVREVVRVPDPLAWEAWDVQVRPRLGCGGHSECMVACRKP